MIELATVEDACLIHNALVSRSSYFPNVQEQITASDPHAKAQTIAATKPNQIFCIILS